MVSSSAVRKDGRIDPHALALHVDQGATRVAGIDGRIGLDEILIPARFDIEVAAAGGAHDSHRHRLADAERIPDRQHDVPNLQLRGIRQRQRRQTGGIDLQQGHVGLRVRAHHFRRELAVVV
jgi:hypothetical protein